MENQQLRKHILAIYTASQKRIGAAKIQRVLLRDYGISISVGRVYRLMKSMNLPKMSTSKPAFRTQNRQVSLDRPNHLKQAFNPPAPNQVWTSDFSYIPVGTKITTDLAISTFKKAIRSRNVESPVLFHTDQGSQYTSTAFRKYLEDQPIIQSLSKPGYPWDNAVTEAFFKYMKKEELNRRTFSCLQEVQLSCFEYIEGFYNSQRPHGTLDMLTPNEMEENYFDFL